MWCLAPSQGVPNPSLTARYLPNLPGLCLLGRNDQAVPSEGSFLVQHRAYLWRGVHRGPVETDFSPDSGKVCDSV